MRPILVAAALASAGLLAACVLTSPVQAHVVAGSRVFPVTLTLDDPGTADEGSLPSLVYQRSVQDGGTGPTHSYNLGFEFDKTITPNTALILNGGYRIQQTNGSKTQAGFQNLYITGKWQVFLNAPHEFVASVGVIRELGGTGTSTSAQWI